MSSMGSIPPRTLIADDQPDVLEALRLLLKGEGIQIEAVTSPAAALEAIRRSDFDLLLMDLNYARDTTSGQEGLDLVANVRALDSTLPVVVMTAWGNMELAIEAMRRGVRDFVLKPWENRQLVSRLRTQIDIGRAARGRQRLAAEQEHELEEARKIQQRLLPSEIPQLRDYTIASAWQPARVVGGDYFDVLLIDEQRVALCIADVSGKGMPAALLMSNVQATVKAYAFESIGPAALSERVNRMVSINTDRDRFVTFVYCVLDCRSHKLVYTNAGHNAPILIRDSGAVLPLDRGGSVLGPFEESVYEEVEIDFGPGDRLVLFTDGVTEATNAAGEEFGEDRLIDLLVHHRRLNASGLRDRVIAAVGEFSGGSFDDDVTLIAVSCDKPAG
jgi:phosphoserine phosphatase RsbU/P